MTDREKLINQISGILLVHDCLTDEVQSEIFLALDLYEIRKRSTELIPADPMDNEAMIRDFAAAKAVAGRSPKSVRQYVLALRRFTRTMPIRLVDTTATDIRKYTAIRLTRDGLQGRGLVNERDYLSAFFEWAVKAEIMARNPVKQVERILKEIGKRAGVSNVHAHRFRRTAATMALRRGMPLEMVSKMLRHENLQTTMRYLDLTEEELFYQHQKYVV